MSPEMIAGFAADVRIHHRAWVLDAVFDVDSHPHLVNAVSKETEISHPYMNFFESCDSYIAYTMKGFDLISFSMPRDRSSLLNKNDVPGLAILLPIVPCNYEGTGGCLF